MLTLYRAHTSSNQRDEESKLPSEEEYDAMFHQAFIDPQFQPNPRFTSTPDDVVLHNGLPNMPKCKI